CSERIMTQSGGGTPPNLAEDLLDDPGADFGADKFQGRMSIQNSQWLPEPAVGLVGIVKHVFRQRLDARQPHQLVGFLDRQPFLARLAMPSRAWRNDVLGDLLFGETAAREVLERLQRDAPHNGAREIGLRIQLFAQHLAAAELAIDRGDDRFSHGSILRQYAVRLWGICRKSSQSLQP